MFFLTKELTTKDSRRHGCHDIQSFLDPRPIFRLSFLLHRNR